LAVQERGEEIKTAQPQSKVLKAGRRQNCQKKVSSMVQCIRMEKEIRKPFGDA
jgi:hypothetical protein